jgi:hypothetical protein
MFMMICKLALTIIRKFWHLVNNIYALMFFPTNSRYCATIAWCKYSQFYCLVYDTLDTDSCFTS